MNKFIIKTMMKSLKEIFEKYKNFANVFDKINANKLLEHNSQNYIINIKNKMFLFKSIYNLLMIEFELLKKYLNDFLTKKFIVFFYFHSQKHRFYLLRNRNMI
jgi:hypothetical protein